MITVHFTKKKETNKITVKETGRAAKTEIAQKSTPHTGAAEAPKPQPGQKDTQCGGPLRGLTAQ